MDKPRGRPGTRRKWNQEMDYVIHSGGIIDIRRDKSKPIQIMDLSGMEMPYATKAPQPTMDDFLDRLLP